MADENPSELEAKQKGMRKMQEEGVVSVSFKETEKKRLSAASDKRTDERTSELKKKHDKRRQIEEEGVVSQSFNKAEEERLSAASDDKRTDERTSELKEKHDVRCQIEEEGVASQSFKEAEEKRDATATNTRTDERSSELKEKHVVRRQMLEEGVVSKACRETEERVASGGKRRIDPLAQASPELRDLMLKNRADPQHGFLFVERARANLMESGFLSRTRSIINQVRENRAVPSRKPVFCAYLEVHFRGYHLEYIPRAVRARLHDRLLQKISELWQVPPDNIMDCDGKSGPAGLLTLKPGTVTAGGYIADGFKHVPAQKQVEQELSPVFYHIMEEEQQGATQARNEQEELALAPEKTNIIIAQSGANMGDASGDEIQYFRVRDWQWEKESLSVSGPPWTIARDGLNVVGFCKNAICPVNLHVTNMGFVTKFRVVDQPYRCSRPECGRQLSLPNSRHLAFHNCWARVAYSQQRLEEAKWKDTGDASAFTFRLPTDAEYLSEPTFYKDPVVSACGRGTPAWGLPGECFLLSHDAGVFEDQEAWKSLHQVKKGMSVTVRAPAQLVGDFFAVPMEPRGLMWLTHQQAERLMGQQQKKGEARSSFASRLEQEGEDEEDQAWQLKLSQLLASTPVPTCLKEAIKALELPAETESTLEAILNVFVEKHWPNRKEMIKNDFKKKDWNCQEIDAYPVDFVKAIHAYTLEHPSLYVLVNKDVLNDAKGRTKGGDVANAVLKVLPLTKYWMEALNKLPGPLHYEGMLYRFMAYRYTDEQLRTKYFPRHEVVKYAFLSCSPTVEGVLGFAGDKAKRGLERTMFSIDAKGEAYVIKYFSNYPDEDEVLLKPLVTLRVKSPHWRAIRQSFSLHPEMYDIALGSYPDHIQFDLPTLAVA
eukprot:TRINITY_DN6593_c0_g2_i4.p1 TRINITY_DN6593_c0_g2~~TRINITY_DN6593_c0_g2_i4.p1  ORF type:complete len:914 (+),score=179.68 TRINITY_DN6593_c0_g2_i4:93-2744(+)